MLTLSILRCPNGVPSETRHVSGGEFTIGRDTRNDWVLPDPDRYLSKRHCVLGSGATGWQINDTSTNGTYLNHEIEPLRGSPRALRDGDRILMGAYEMEVSLHAEEERLAEPAAAQGPVSPAPPAPAGDTCRSCARRAAASSTSPPRPRSPARAAPAATSPRRAGCCRSPGNGRPTCWPTGYGSTR